MLTTNGPFASPTYSQWYRIGRCERTYLTSAATSAGVPATRCQSCPLHQPAVLFARQLDWSLLVSLAVQPSFCTEITCELAATNASSLDSMPPGYLGRLGGLTVVSWSRQRLPLQPDVPRMIAFQELVGGWPGCRADHGIATLPLYTASAADQYVPTGVLGALVPLVVGGLG